MPTVSSQLYETGKNIGNFPLIIVLGEGRIGLHD